MISPCAAASSKIVIPRSSVSPKRSSSAASTRWISSRCSTSSGYACAHLLDHDVGEARQERRLHPDAQAVLDGAADDPAQDIAAALVRRRHALGGDERHAAAVVGEHAMRLRRVLDEPYATPDCSATQSMISW